jgi:hypothetical protein
MRALAAGLGLAEYESGGLIWCFATSIDAEEVAEASGTMWPWRR